jgi:CspA family cold shock protein
MEETIRSPGGHPPHAESWKNEVMATGKVKWFNNKRGYGFIVPEEQGPEVFVHQTAIKGTGYRTLNQGEPVSFDLVVSDKGPKAENVQRARA